MISNTEKQIQEAILLSKQTIKTYNPNLKYIPVVVHVIHDGGTNNISDAQIQSQIDVLNEDFRKIAGSNGDGAGVDTEIEFCLAKKDPQGRCTNGIVRINSPLSNHQTYQRSQLKQLSFWDNTRYLNMYVVKNINSGSGILGYSSFPSGPPDEDGIVVRHDYFGKIGTASTTLGRTTSHEIGHWLGLYHTFNNGCDVDTCSGGDYVCDTPPVANPNFGCPVGINSCTNDSYPDQIYNYMDYSNDNCKNIFTDGQKQRMQTTLTTLRYDIWQPWNIDSTGCDSGYVSSNCNVIADYVTLTTDLCVGSSITFYNKSQNNPTGYQWYFQGGTPATSTLANPTVTYSSVGMFNVKLVVSNIYGSDSLEILNYINVTTPSVGQALPFFEGFESFGFPPSGITISNPDAGITWERDTIAVAYAGNTSAKINNLININYGQSDALVLPNFDFTSFTGTPYLNFKWAYAKSDANYSDELIVLASKDCGVNWTQIFYRTGSGLVTGPTQTTPYIPDTNTVWKTANINMNTYASFTNVSIKIVNVTDGGNNLYIDNINLGTSPVGITEFDNTDGITIFPNPTSNILNIALYVSQAEKIVYELNDVLGQTVIVNSAEINKGDNQLQLNLHELKSGIYFITIKTKNKTIVSKLIKE